METLIYLAKVNLYWILLYGCYQLMLRNHTFFQWNRFYLLGSLGIAFALPFIIYPETAPALPVQYEFTADSFTLSTVEEIEKPVITWTNALWLSYSIGLVISLFNFGKHILQLKNFLNSGETIDLEDCKVVLIDSNNVGSFSFMRWIVINRNDYENHFDAILRHEMVHTQQHHSLDILLIEALNAIFWFNPVLLLYKRSFQEVHEFLADEQAPNREYYARFLVSYALNAPVASLTNHFFKPSQIKDRIQMIYKNRSSKWLLGTYGIALLSITIVASLVAGCDSSVQRDEAGPTEAEKKQKMEKLANKPIFTVVEEQPVFPGGTKKMYEFLGDNLEYPEEASKANVEGRVFLSFIVTEEGEIADVKVLKGIGYGCDEEAIRVLYKFPKWQPGRQNGRLVNVRYNLPIQFKLDNKDEEKADVTLKSNGADPLIMLDGKVISKDQMESTDIKSINVLKGDAARSKYGNKGADGVLEITSKADKTPIATPEQVKRSMGESTLRELNQESTPTRFKITENPLPSGQQPLVFIDGEKQDLRGSAAYGSINSDQIQSISVLKNQSAIDVYGEEGRDGVVLITTKK